MAWKLTSTRWENQSCHGQKKVINCNEINIYPININAIVLTDVLRIALAWKQMLVGIKIMCKNYKRLCGKYKSWIQNYYNTYYTFGCVLMKWKWQYFHVCSDAERSIFKMHCWHRVINNINNSVSCKLVLLTRNTRYAKHSLFDQFFGWLSLSFLLNLAKFELLFMLEQITK